MGRMSAKRQSRRDKKRCPNKLRAWMERLAREGPPRWTPQLTRQELGLEDREANCRRAIAAARVGTSVLHPYRRNPLQTMALIAAALTR